jgi:diguanylate cyclase (GGDEF)-like protein/hemerythrin-like metal-binding protein
LDVDDFKRVNDTRGHAIGDQVLRELVGVISKSIRTSDMLFRWGGEEFVILAPSTSYAAAGGLAETLRSRIEQQGIQTAGNITVSLGVAEHDSSESESEWFRRADMALYSAKNSGRNRVVVDPRGNSDRWTTDQGATLLRLHWHRTYNCGDATIDLEHRQLFELANALIDAAFTRGANPQAFDFALDKLLVHIARHFAHEEAILARHKYAQLDAHALAHKKLLDRARQLRTAAAAGGGVTIGELVDFLADEVVARHMLKADREFYPLFKKAHSPS